MSDYVSGCPDYRRNAGGLVIANPNAQTGIALKQTDIVRLLDDHPDSPVVIDEAYVDFGGETAAKLIGNYPNLVIVRTFSKIPRPRRASPGDTRWLMLRSSRLSFGLRTASTLIRLAA